MSDQPDETPVPETDAGADLQTEGEKAAKAAEAGDTADDDAKDE